MTHYTANNYRIEIDSDQTWDERPDGSSHPYDFIYIDPSRYDFSSIVGVKIFQSEKLIKSAALGSIGSGITIHDKSVIIEDERLLVCCADMIYCLSIPELALVWKTMADQSMCFGIYKYQDTYIIHGELQISRLDKNGKILWQLQGGDVFVRVNGKEDFVITENHILAKDWENRKYKIDFGGRLIW